MEFGSDYRDGEIQSAALQVLLALEAPELRKLWKLEGDIYPVPCLCKHNMNICVPHSFGVRYSSDLAQLQCSRSLQDHTLPTSNGACQTTVVGANLYFPVQNATT
jgi:hypothetical protein